VLSKVDTSFFVGDFEYRLDSFDSENNTALVTKLSPDSDPITHLLSIFKASEQSADASNKDNELDKPASIEEAFNSFF
jgi:hypothetical protein